MFVSDERLDVVETLVGDTSLRMSLREDLLRKMPDFQRLKKRFVTRSASLADYYRVYTCLNTIPNLLATLEGNEGEHAAAITAMFSQPLQVVFVGMEKLIKMIEYSLDLDKAAGGEYVVKAGIDEALDGGCRGIALLMFFHAH